MLAYAFQELKQNNYEEVESEKFDDIYELFAELLARGIAYQLKQGLYRAYVPAKESMPTLRGKLDVNGTIANRMQNDRKLACEYDDLSENNIYNQILVSTARILILNSDVKKEQKARLKRLMLFFHNVEAIEPHDIRWKNLRFDRNNSNYRMLLYICYFIVNEWLLTTDEGKFKIREFSDSNMERLFEKFILEYYKRHFPELNANPTQIGWNIIEEDTDKSVLPVMQTDVMLSTKERTLIIDAKYYTRIMQERFGKETLRNSHLYQIRTYVDEYDKDHLHNVDGMLLYAKIKEEDLEDAQIRHRDGFTLFIRTLDLNTDFESIKQRLNSFKSLMQTR